MKRVVVCLLVAVLTALGSSAFSFGENDAPAKFLVVGRVAKVIDGDTFDLRQSDGRMFRIRLWGIDAPEIDTEPGKAAKQALSELVLLISGPLACELRGRSYNRTVARCSHFGTSGGILDLAEAIVRVGYARDWPRYSKGWYTEAQDYARSQRIGLWQ